MKEEQMNVWDLHAEIRVFIVSYKNKFFNDNEVNIFI